MIKEKNLLKKKKLQQYGLEYPVQTSISQIVLSKHKLKVAVNTVNEMESELRKNSVERTNLQKSLVSCFWI